MAPRSRSGAYPCPQCGTAMEVVDSRPSIFLATPSVRRRRACMKCDHRHTTYEVSTEAMKTTFAAVAAAVHQSAQALQTTAETIRKIEIE